MSEKWDVPRDMILWRESHIDPLHKLTDEQRARPDYLTGWLSHGVCDDKGREIGSVCRVYWNTKSQLWDVRVEGGRDGVCFGSTHAWCATHLLHDALNRAQRFADEQARKTLRKTAARAAKEAT